MIYIEGFDNDSSSISIINNRENERENMPLFLSSYFKKAQSISCHSKYTFFVSYFSVDNAALYNLPKMTYDWQ